MLRAFSFVLLVQALPGAAQQHTLSLPRELALVGTAGLLHTGSILLVRRPLAHPGAPLDPLTLPRIDRIATGRWDPSAHRASSILFGAGAGLSLAAAALLVDGDRPVVPVTIVLESGLLAAGATNLVKELTRRPRPYLYDPVGVALPYKGRDDHHAFWSGHVANISAMAFSTAWMVQRSNTSPAWRAVAWSGAFVVPVSMAWLRVRAGRHFPTDVLTGFVFGAAMGWAVPYFHRRVRGGRT
jgi:membrane-associated phospholipid phosphatase